ncbi:MAG: DUF1800 family protein [Nonlabens sp.]
MNREALWSLRLGFSTAQQEQIKNAGMEAFLNTSFSYKPKIVKPSFLDGLTMDLKSIKQHRKSFQQLTVEEKKIARKQQRMDLYSMTYDWIDRMQAAEYPLRENMTCFWHNHFVVTYGKVKVAPWIFEHQIALYDGAFGNFRELTKSMVRSNAMISYLDNNKNRKDSNNENLARELLELFTLGIGNYTENDIKAAAQALAGLGHGDGGGKYRKRLRETEPMTFMGETGVFDSDDIVTIIFEQPNAPYLITEKILKWFLYDDPSKEDVKKYEDFLRAVDYEMQPFLKQLFLEEFKKDAVAVKIKDPLRFALQTLQELHLNDRIESEQIGRFLKEQSMELYNQPNVKGWEGGQSWLTSAIYLRRNQVARWLAAGERISNRKKMNRMRDPELPDLKIPKSLSTNKEIIAYLLDQTLSVSTPVIQSDLEEILKYDFKPHEPGSELGILRAYTYIITTPEYQVI